MKDYKREKKHPKTPGQLARSFERIASELTEDWKAVVIIIKR